MAYAAWSTAGTQLAVTISSVSTSIPGVEGIPTVSPGQKPQIDTTPISATASSSVVGVPAPGTVNFNIMWDPGDTVHQYLLASFNAAGGTNETWTITCNDAGDATVGFTGYIQSFDINLDKNAVAKASIAIALSSGLTVTP